MDKTKKLESNSNYQIIIRDLLDKPAPPALTGPYNQDLSEQIKFVILELQETYKFNDFWIQQDLNDKQEYILILITGKLNRDISFKEMEEILKKRIDRVSWVPGFSYTEVIFESIKKLNNNQVPDKPTKFFQDFFKNNPINQVTKPVIIILSLYLLIKLSD